MRIYHFCCCIYFEKAKEKTVSVDNEIENFLTTKNSHFIF